MTVGSVAAAYPQPSVYLGLAFGTVLLASAFGAVDVFIAAVLMARPLIEVGTSNLLVVVSDFSVFQSEGLNAAGLLSLGVIALTPFTLRLARGRSLLWPPLIAYAALTAWSCASVLVADDKLVAVAQTSRLLSILAFACIVQAALERVRGEFVWRAVALSSILPVAVGFFQATSGLGNTDATVGLVRIQGTFSHPNTFGHYLVIASLATAGVAMSTANKRLFWLVLLGLQGAALVLTYSRGAWLALVVAGFLAVISLGRRYWPWILPLLAGAIVVAALNWSAIEDRFASLLIDDSAVNTLLGRELIWQERIDLLVDQGPVGLGIGSSNVIADRVAMLPMAAHNDHLRVLFELGVVGFIVWICFFALIFLLSARLIGSEMLDVSRVGVAISVGVAAAYVAGGFFENLLTTTAYQWYWWATLLAGIAMTRAAIPVGANDREAQTH